MTIGADRVRVSFNPSGNATVDQIKQKTVELIDICETGKEAATNGEIKRQWALAQTDYENAAMWAVKAATA